MAENTQTKQMYESGSGAQAARDCSAAFREHAGLPAFSFRCDGGTSARHLGCDRLEGRMTATSPSL